jgi:adenine nucleotide transporter 17
MDAAIEGLSGALGAVLSLTLTYPLLTVSTLRAVEQQQQGQQEEQPAAAAAAIADAPSTASAAAMTMLLAPLRDVSEHAARFGWHSLFAGLQPAVAATAVSQGIYFSAYAALRRAAVAHRLRSSKGGRVDAAAAAQLGVGASILVASAAGCINVLLTNPWWVVVTTMQARAGEERPNQQQQQQEQEEAASGGKAAAARAPARRSSTAGSNNGALSVARAIWRERGWRGFCAGLAPSLVMVLNPTINYVLYEALVARWAAVRLERRRRSGALRGPAARAAAAALPPAAAL